MGIKGSRVDCVYRSALELAALILKIRKRKKCRLGIIFQVYIFIFLFVKYIQL